MSCSVCAGHDSRKCPCCGSGPGMKECPDCEAGVQFFSFNIKTRKFVQVTKVAFQILPFDEDDARYEGKNYCQGDIRRCPTCKGDGKIPEEY